MKKILSINFLVSLLKLFCLESYAMEEQTTPEPAGLTAARALELLCDAQKEEKGSISVFFDNPHVPKLKMAFLCTTGICGATIIIPGILPGTILGSIFCQYAAFWQEGSCQALIGSAVAPVALNIANGVAWTLASPFYNWWARKSNAEISRTGVELIQRELPENHPLSLGDFQKIVPYVFDAPDGFFKELNLKQTLALARNNKSKFADLIKRSAFDATVQKNAKLYLDALNMNPDSLVGYLQDQEIAKCLKEQPALLEGLILALPASALSNQLLHQRLLYCLQDVYNKDDNERLFVHFANGQPYENFNIENFSIKVQNAVQVKISLGNEKIWLEQDQFPGINSKLAAKRNIKTDFEELLQPSGTFEIDILELLNLAHVQKLENLVKQCDFSLRLNGISEELFAQWLADQKMASTGSYYLDRLNFCRYFDLHRTKERIVRQLTQALNKFERKKDIFQAIKALDSDSQQRIFKQFNVKEFESQLSSASQLQWFGDTAIEFDIHELKNIIGNFCRKNKPIAYEVWNVLPTEFGQPTEF